MESFSRLGLAESLAQALASFGFNEATKVQTEAIPVLLSRHDAIIESETGTGKTFAYLAPAFQLASSLDRRSSGEPGAIIAAPTQELAVQIGREADRLAKAAELPMKTAVLIGGTAIDKQLAKLRAKPDIIIGTLGRLADLVALGRIRTTSLKILILDEADRLFAPETLDLATALVKSAPASSVRVMVSATVPEKARREMTPLLRDPVSICPQSEAVLSESIEHWCFYCDGRKRLDFMRRFEAAVHPDRCLLFLSAASRVEKSALALDHYGLPIAAIHSGMDKEERRVALEQFSTGVVRYLLTSDLGARGLDIPGISHVVSLDLPEEATIYTHRAGRTGRAGAHGISVALADAVELKRASKIATKGNFVFRCKILEEGKVLEPTSEEFFARANEAEAQKMEAKAANLDRDEERMPRSRLPKHEAPFDPTEAKRSATAPKNAPWRDAKEDQEESISGPSLPRLRKKSKTSEAPRGEAESPRDSASGRPARPRSDYTSREDRPYRPRKPEGEGRVGGRFSRDDKPYSPRKPAGGGREGTRFGREGGSFGREDKPYRPRKPAGEGRDTGSFSREDKPYRPRKPAGEGREGGRFSHEDKPYRPRKAAGEGRDSGSFSREDKPYRPRKPAGEGRESGRFSREGGSFGREDKPYRPRKTAGESHDGGRFSREGGSRSRDGQGKPAGRGFDRRSESSRSRPGDSRGRPTGRSSGPRRSDASGPSRPRGPGAPRKPRDHT